MSKGRVTIPSDKDFIEGTKKIAALWGADAVRDCDGTKLPSNAGELAEKVYNTYFVVRGDNEWADENLDKLQNVLLMSERVIATQNILKIKLLDGYLAEQLEVNEEDPHKYWQVMDRTSGQETPDWEYDGAGCVIVKDAVPFHEYTVNFFAKNVWDSTQMYNYITNGWTCEKHKVLEPRCRENMEHFKEKLISWCEQNQGSNVVRFTTFLYHFFLVFNEKSKEKHVDWFGYPMTASPRAFDAFEKEYGYKIRTEDIVDGGSYHNNFKNPSKKYLDYMNFVQKYVSRTVKTLVDIVHSHGKEAMMFLGDSWIGAEPYGGFFKEMNIDAVVGSIGGGVTVRMLSDIQGIRYTEGRFLPYFFPDTFFEGNEENAVKELNHNWITARRALMRNPLDRIGYGGYLSLAAKFPKFIERVSEICNEFREIYAAVDKKKPYCVLKVALLNSWGKLRSWQCFMVAHELWYQQIYSYQGVLEALSGLPVEVGFINFEDIKNGRADDYDCIINVGDRDTAWTGGDNWLEPEVVAKIREFVYNGGGFIGIGEPTAIQSGGKLFQLSDVLGVDEEIGYTLSEDKYNIEKVDGHFITKDVSGEMDYGEDKKNIYAHAKAQVLDIRFSDRCKRNVNSGEVKMAVNEYGKGRSFYVTGLPYSFQNARLLYRAMLWTVKKENYERKVFSTNINTDCSYYPNTKAYAIINNSSQPQMTDFYDADGKKSVIQLDAYAIKWVK